MLDYIYKRVVVIIHTAQKSHGGHGYFTTHIVFTYSVRVLVAT